MGRPKGSKNKPKVITPENTTLSVPEVPVAKKGSAVPAAPAPAAEAPKRRGRPPGSTNKPKVAAEEPAPKLAAPAPVATGEAPKRRGRPPGSTNKPKAVAAEAPAPVTVPPVLVKPTATVTVVPDTDEAGEEEAEKQVSGPPVYSVEDLKNPALDPLVEHVAAIAALASPSRKVFYEERALPGISYELRVLKTLIDYLEIDVKKYIEDNEVA